MTVISAILMLLSLPVGNAQELLWGQPELTGWFHPGNVYKMVNLYAPFIGLAGGERAMAASDALDDLKQMERI